MLLAYCQGHERKAYALFSKLTVRFLHIDLPSQAFEFFPTYFVTNKESTLCFSFREIPLLTHWLPLVQNRLRSNSDLAVRRLCSQNLSNFEKDVYGKLQISLKLKHSGKIREFSLSSYGSMYGIIKLSKYCQDRSKNTNHN